MGLFFCLNRSVCLKIMTALIDPQKYTKTVDLLRSFFLSKGFYEVHTQNRLSILAACEDPETVATYEYNGEVWPLPQTGQMWLEYELLKNPEAPGFFCVSTSYREKVSFFFLQSYYYVGKSTPYLPLHFNKKKCLRVYT